MCVGCCRCCCLLFVVRCSLFVGWSLMFVVFVRCLLFVVYCGSFVVLLFVVCSVWFVVC